MVMTAGEAFLRRFHAHRPAVTGQTLGAGRAADGRRGYEVLRDQVTGSRRVLDLGCGDGVLLELLAHAEGRRATDTAGVDLSPEALRLAAARPALAGAVLVEGRAQELPFAKASFDACVSHMTFMLLDEVDRVAEELARVLVPGGVFACAVGGGAAGGAYELFLQLVRPLLDAVPEENRMPVLGDRRTRTRDGLDEVLGAAGFAPVDWETLHLDLSGPADRVWSTVSAIYDLQTLSSSAVAELRRLFLAEAEAITPNDGPTPCAMKLHVATSRRA